MTLADIRTDIRTLAKDTSAEAGTLFPSDNAIIDLFINMAVELVVVDLVPYLSTWFLDYEDINLVALTQPYTLTKEWIQIWNMAQNVSGERPRPLEYIPWHDELLAQYVGETADYPPAWTLKGNTIMFLPKPASAQTAYARAWIIKPEVATMVTGGPAMIPRIAHRLIPLKALELISVTLEVGILAAWEKLYNKFFGAIQRVLGNLVQGQPRFLGSSFREKQFVDRRDPAFFDTGGFFK